MLFRSRNSITAGNYSVTASDNNLCSASLSVTITEPPALTLTETHVNVLCNGGTGSIDVTSGGGVAPRTYVWDDGITTEDRINLAPGNYSVTVNDNNSCSSSLNMVIGSNAGIVITETHTNVSCFAGSNGSIDVSVNGGVQPYSYLWNDAIATPDRIDRKSTRLNSSH